MYVEQPRAGPMHDRWGLNRSDVPGRSGASARAVAVSAATPGALRRIAWVGACCAVCLTGSPQTPDAPR